jgi:hypothetical protein
MTPDDWAISIGILRELADLGSCETEPDKCGFGSGPHCDWHGTNDAGDLVRKAKDFLVRLELLEVK